MLNDLLRLDPETAAALDHLDTLIDDTGEPVNPAAYDAARINLAELILNRIAAGD